MRDDLRTSILHDTPREPVAVPWVGDEKFFLQGLEADAKDAYVTELMDLMAKLVCLTLVTEDGDLVFTAEDAPDLRKKYTSAVTSWYEVAARLSGIAEDTPETIQADFKPGQSSHSATG